MVDIPIIDFEDFAGYNRSARTEVARKIDLAASESGFMYIKNVSIDAGLIASAFQASSEFFSLPHEVKESFYYRPEMNFGYQPLGGQRLDHSISADLKETLTMRDVPSNLERTELWPSLELSEISERMFKTCLDGSNLIMEAFAIALKLPIDFFRKSHLGECAALRYLRYPNVDYDVGSSQMGAGAHTDFGTITLLFQDEVGGLEVQGLDDNWYPAPYIKDTIVVNTGDLMARWTNEKYRSTPHRVRPLLAAQTTVPERYSIAFFADPDNETPVSVLDSCVGPGNPAKYPPTTAGEHIAGKIRESHNLEP